MVFSLKDLKHLEVLAELSNKPAIQEEMPKISDLIKEEKKEPSFDENILSLCSSLRGSGFEKQAIQLEDKFVFFKQAEANMFNLHNETGEDVINSAHPDGDAKTEGGELGDVETIVSRHKKIVDMVNKQPTGKHAAKKIDLKAYVNQCSTVLKQGQLATALFGPAGALFDSRELLTELTSVFGNYASKAKSLILNLNSILGDQNITKFSDLTSQINSIIELLQTLANNRNDYQELIVEPKGKEDKIVEAKTFLGDLKQKLSLLHSSLLKVYSNINDSLGSSIVNFFSPSILQKAATKTSDLYQEVSKLNNFFPTAQNTVVPVPPSNDPKKAASDKIQSLIQMVTNNTKLTADQKAGGIKHLNDVNTKLQTAKPEELDMILKGLNEFETNWK